MDPRQLPAKPLKREIFVSFVSRSHEMSGPGKLKNRVAICQPPG